MSDFAQAHYFRYVKLFYFAEPGPFGQYDKETGDLTILIENAMGPMKQDELKVILDTENKAGQLYASAITYGVPRKAYELREQVRDRMH